MRYIDVDAQSVPTRAELDKRISALSRPARELLLELYDTGDPVRCDVLTRSPGDRPHIQALQEADLVIPVVHEGRPWDKSRYFMLPDEVRMAVARRDLKQLTKKGLLIKKADVNEQTLQLLRPGADRKSAVNLGGDVVDNVMDLTTLLAWVHHAPRPVTTKDRALYKREQAKLLKLFRYQETVPKGHDAAPYPFGLGLLIYYAVGDGLLVINEQTSMMESGPWATVWATMPIEIRQARFVAYWWQWLLSQAALRSFFEVLAQIPSGQGIAPGTLVDHLYPEGRWRESCRDQAQTLMPTIVRMGLLTLGAPKSPPQPRRIDVRELIWFATPPEPVPTQVPSVEPDQCLTIQPNLDVLVSQYAPPERLWSVYQCAELVASDRMMCFRLTDASIRGALEAGQSGETLLQSLTQASRHPIPQNVQVMLEDWIKRAGSNRLVEATLLACQDEAEADQLALLAQETDLRLNRIGPTHFLIDPDQADAWRDHLNALGRPALSGTYKAVAGAAAPRLIRSYEPKENTSRYTMDEIAAARAGERDATPAEWATHYGGNPFMPVARGGAESLTVLDGEAWVAAEGGGVR